MTSSDADQWLHSSKSFEGDAENMVVDIDLNRRAILIEEIVDDTTPYIFSERVVQCLL